jgi:hypothetical protein
MVRIGSSRDFLAGALGGAIVVAVCGGALLWWRVTAPAAQVVTTLVLGLVAGYIAWRQWRTAQDRLVLDLFDRRFQVFYDLTRAIAEAFNKSLVSVDDLNKFDVARERARFLFGPEVPEYLQLVRRHLIELIAKERVVSEMPEGEARTRTENQLVAAQSEMHMFYGKLVGLMTPYLRMTTQA